MTDKHTINKINFNKIRGDIETILKNASKDAYVIVPTNPRAKTYYISMFKDYYGLKDFSVFAVNDLRNIEKEL